VPCIVNWRGATPGIREKRKMPSSFADEALQSKPPFLTSALWGSRSTPTFWRKRVELWWNSSDRDAVEPPKGPAWRTVAMFACALMLFCFTSAIAGNAKQPTTVIDITEKVSPELRPYLTLPSMNSINVVVQLNKRGSFKVSDFERKFNDERKGGKLRRELKNVQVVTLTIPSTYIFYLASMDGVRYVSLDRPVRMSLDRAAKTVAADIGWSFGLKGKGIGIAVIDSGVWNHPDLNEFGSTASRVVYSESFVTGDTNTNDLYGHGTHVAGIAGGNGQSSANGYEGQYRGIAPEVNIVNLRVLDANGGGTDSAVIAAIDRAIELKGRYNIRVINLSLGRPVFESYTNDPLCQAVEAAWQAGIVVVVAAGNNGRDNSFGTRGYGTVAAPGNDPYVITVGATDMGSTPYRADDVIASYSAKGPTLLDHVVKPDLVAPGNRVVSLVDPAGTLEAANPKLDIYPCDASTGKCDAAVGGAQYFRLSGTSMAAPIVSGAVALMVQQDPELTPDLIKARLMKTAWKGFTTFSATKDAKGNSYKNQADIFTYGAGYLDVQAALQSTDAGSGAALSPVATYNRVTGQVSLSFGPAGSSVMWGSSVLWGSSVIWGSAIVDSKTNALWGSSVVWGSTLDTGFSVIWGSSVIWGAATTTAFSPGDEGDCSVDDLTCGLDSTTMVTGTSGSLGQP